MAEARRLGAVPEQRRSEPRESVGERAAQDWFVEPGAGAGPQRWDPLDLDPVSLVPRPREGGLLAEELGGEGLTADVLSAPLTGDVGEAVSPLSILLGGSGEGDLAWQDQALCAQTDPEAFFPEKGGSTREAKKVCASCEVRSECLEYALANDERFGIWGGMSERERRRLKKQAV